MEKAPTRKRKQATNGRAKKPKLTEMIKELGPLCGFCESIQVVAEITMARSVWTPLLKFLHNRSGWQSPVTITPSNGLILQERSDDTCTFHDIALPDHVVTMRPSEKVHTIIPTSLLMTAFSKMWPRQRKAVFKLRYYVSNREDCKYRLFIGEQQKPNCWAEIPLQDAYPDDELIPPIFTHFLKVSSVDFVSAIKEQHPLSTIDMRLRDSKLTISTKTVDQNEPSEKQLVLRELNVLHESDRQLFGPICLNTTFLRAATPLLAISDTLQFSFGVDQIFVCKCEFSSDTEFESTTRKNVTSILPHDAFPPGVLHIVFEYAIVSVVASFSYYVAPRDD